MKYVTTSTERNTQTIFVIWRRIGLHHPSVELVLQKKSNNQLTTYSMEGSLREFLQMAQVSAQMWSQDHIVTALHFLISKRTPPLEEELAGTFAEEVDSTSAIFVKNKPTTNRKKKRVL